jgi:hypothetical protein
VPTIHQREDVQVIKAKLTAAANAAELPGSAVGQACWGYFASDVLRLIEDHTKLKQQLEQIAAPGHV